MSGCCGYGGMHYGGYQYKATKPGGLSAVPVRDLGDAEGGVVNT